MSSRLGVLLLLCVLGSFVAAVFVGMSASNGNLAESTLLLFAGTSAIVFSRRLADAAHYLVERGLAPKSWGNTRPLLFFLWGFGVSCLGFIQLLGW